MEGEPTLEAEMRFVFIVLIILALVALIPLRHVLVKRARETGRSIRRDRDNRRL